MCCGKNTSVDAVVPHLDLQKELDNREEIIKDLLNQLDEKENSWAKNIDEFVDKWFDENKDEVNIGVINFGLFKLDVFPNYLEKHIYKKVLKILYSFLTSHRM